MKPSQAELDRAPRRDSTKCVRLHEAIKQALEEGSSVPMTIEGIADSVNTRALLSAGMVLQLTLAKQDGELLAVLQEAWSPNSRRLLR